MVALLGVILNVLPFADWERRHLDLFRRWSDFREEIDALLFEASDKLDSATIDRLKALDAKSHRLCGLEPSADEPFLTQCFNAEVKSRMPATDGEVETAQQETKPVEV